ncbi:gluconate 2-dehydrogenase subunit 3 family protein [Arenimonas alkanexedens]
MDASLRRFTRRQALATISAALAGLALPGAKVAWAVASDAVSWPGAIEPCFAAFCDTLIPADALSPSATALGVPSRILAELPDNAMLRRLFELSCLWLDQAAGGRFDALDEDSRGGIAEAMSLLPWEAPQRRFFDLVRDLAMGWYYADPAALAGFATRAPPQPAGYFESLE